MHLHILGICGTFMGGIAAIAQQAGFRVTGCDANVYPPMSEQLRALGVELIDGYAADQLRLRPDLWVIGNVVTRGNPLMEAILDQGDRYVSGPQWLAENVLISKWVLAVAGTHGKTTTSSMLAWILECAGRAPGFLIGGIAPDLRVSARSSASDSFVIEADEYDTAFFDKRSKFVHYRPKTAVLNNLEFDHADIFGDLAEIERQFHHLVRTVPSSGRLIVNGRDPALKRVLASGAWTPVEEFGSRSGWEAGEPDGEGGFEIAWQGTSVGRLAWTQSGDYNRMNALAAIAAARHVGVEPDAAISALSRFSGVRRRLELKGTIRGVRVYDDFAHHPTAIHETIAGLRQRHREGRILAVFEPRSNTLKKGILKDALPGSFAAADRVYICDAGLSWNASAVFAPMGARARCEADLEKLVSAIVADAREGDQILVMSNGGFGGIHDKLLAALAQAWAMLVYLHGFNSSPASHKAQILKKRLADLGLGHLYACPALPDTPGEAIRAIEGAIIGRDPRAITFLGSSLGGYYATWLAEKLGCRAALINPAITPHIGLQAYLGTQKNLHTGEPYELTPAHLEGWRSLFVERIDPERYLLLLETGDEVLDWRAAARKYEGARTAVRDGGDHSLQSFPEHIGRILAFAGIEPGK